MKLIDFKLMKITSELHKAIREKYLVNGQMTELDAALVTKLEDLVTKVNSIKDSL